MSWNEYWERLVGRNPELACDQGVLRITVATFRRACQQSYEMGARSSAAQGKDPLEALLSRHPFNEVGV